MNEWQPNTHYTTTDALNDLYELEDLAYPHQRIQSEEEQIPPVSHYQCLIKERDEAVQLLTKVCEHVADKNSTTNIKDKALAWLDQIDGLVEWWLKQKPKSVREQKLEKIASALSLDGKPNDDFRKVAERILIALGE